MRLVDARALIAAEEAGLVSVDADGRIAFTHRSMPQLSVRPPHSIGGGGSPRLAEQVSDPEERARHLALVVQGRTSTRLRPSRRQRKRPAGGAHPVRPRNWRNSRSV
jgi:hypothetical protein